MARRESPDARAVEVELTDAGEEIFEELLAARHAVLEDLLAPLAPESRDALEEALADLLAHLPSRREDAWRICRLCEHRVCRDEACPVGHAVDTLEAAG